MRFEICSLWRKKRREAEMVVAVAVAVAVAATKTRSRVLMISPRYNNDVKMLILEQTPFYVYTPTVYVETTLIGVKFPIPIVYSYFFLLLPTNNAKKSFLLLSLGKQA